MIHTNLKHFAHTRIVCCLWLHLNWLKSFSENPILLSAAKHFPPFTHYHINLTCLNYTHLSSAQSCPLWLTANRGNSIICICCSIRTIYTLSKWIFNTFCPNAACAHIALTNTSNTCPVPVGEVHSRQSLACLSMCSYPGRALRLSFGFQSIRYVFQAKCCNKTKSNSNRKFIYSSSSWVEDSRAPFPSWSKYKQNSLIHLTLSLSSIGKSWVLEAKVFDSWLTKNLEFGFYAKLNWPGTCIR